MEMDGTSIHRPFIVHSPGRLPSKLPRRFDAQQKRASLRIDTRKNFFRNSDLTELPLVVVKLSNVNTN